MKALDKERSRRYESATNLARDIERYLLNESVEACPPSTTYKLRKFANKHRTAFTLAATIVLLLSAGASVSTWQAVRATRAERDARAAQHEAERERDRTLAAQQLSHQRLRQATETSFQVANEIAGNLQNLQGNPRIRRKLNEIVRDGWQNLNRDVPRTTDSDRLAMMIYGNLADASMDLGDLPRAHGEWEEYHKFAEAQARAEPGNRWSQRHFALTYDRLGNICLASGDLPGAEKAYTQFLELCERAEEKLSGDKQSQLDVSDAIRNLAGLKLQAHDHQAAIPLLERSANILRSFKQKGQLASDSIHMKRLEWLEQNIQTSRKAVENPNSEQRQ